MSSNNDTSGDNGVGDKMGEGNNNPSRVQQENPHHNSPGATRRLGSSSSPPLLVPPLSRVSRPGQGPGGTQDSREVHQEEEEDLEGHGKRSKLPPAAPHDYHSHHRGHHPQSRSYHHPPPQHLSHFRSAGEAAASMFYQQKQKHHHDHSSSRSNEPNPSVRNDHARDAHASDQIHHCGKEAIQAQEAVAAQRERHHHHHHHHNQQQQQLYQYHMQKQKHHYYQHRQQYLQSIKSKNNQGGLLAGEASRQAISNTAVPNPLASTAQPSSAQASNKTHSSSSSGFANIGSQNPRPRSSSSTAQDPYCSLRRQQQQHSLSIQPSNAPVSHHQNQQDFENMKLAADSQQVKENLEKKKHEIARIESTKINTTATVPTTGSDSRDNHHHESENKRFGSGNISGKSTSPYFGSTAVNSHDAKVPPSMAIKTKGPATNCKVSSTTTTHLLPITTTTSASPSSPCSSYKRQQFHDSATTTVMKEKLATSGSSITSPYFGAVASITTPSPHSFPSSPPLASSAVSATTNNNINSGTNANDNNSKKIKCILPSVIAPKKSLSSPSTLVAVDADSALTKSKNSTTNSTQTNKLSPQNNPFSPPSSLTASPWIREHLSEQRRQNLSESENEKKKTTNPSPTSHPAALKKQHPRKNLEELKKEAQKFAGYKIGATTPKNPNSVYAILNSAPSFKHLQQEQIWPTLANANITSQAKQKNINENNNSYNNNEGVKRSREFKETPYGDYLDTEDIAAAAAAAVAVAKKKDFKPNYQQHYGLNQPQISQQEQQSKITALSSSAFINSQSNRKGEVDTMEEDDLKVSSAYMSHRQQQQQRQRRLATDENSPAIGYPDKVLHKNANDDTQINNYGDGGLGSKKYAKVDENSKEKLRNTNGTDPIGLSSETSPSCLPSPSLFLDNITKANINKIPPHNNTLDIDNNETSAAAVSTTLQQQQERANEPPTIKKYNKGLLIPTTLEEIVKRASAIVAAEIRSGGWACPALTSDDDDYDGDSDSDKKEVNDEEVELISCNEDEKLDKEGKKNDENRADEQYQHMEVEEDINLTDMSLQAHHQMNRIIEEEIVEKNTKEEKERDFVREVTNRNNDNGNNNVNGMNLVETKEHEQSSKEGEQQEKNVLGNDTVIEDVSNTRTGIFESRTKFLVDHQNSPKQQTINDRDDRKNTKLVPVDGNISLDKLGVETSIPSCSATSTAAATSDGDTNQKKAVLPHHHPFPVTATFSTKDEKISQKEKEFATTTATINSTSPTNQNEKEDPLRATTDSATTTSTAHTSRGVAVVVPITKDSISPNATLAGTTTSPTRMIQSPTERQINLHIGETMTTTTGTTTSTTFTNKADVASIPKSNECNEKCMGENNSLLQENKDDNTKETAKKYEAIKQSTSNVAVAMVANKETTIQNDHKAKNITLTLKKGKNHEVANHDVQLENQKAREASATNGNNNNATSLNTKHVVSSKQIDETIKAAATEEKKMMELNDKKEDRKKYESNEKELSDAITTREQQDKSQQNIVNTNPTSSITTKQTKQNQSHCSNIKKKRDHEAVRHCAAAAIENFAMEVVLPSLLASGVQEDGCGEGNKKRKRGGDGHGDGHEKDRKKHRAFVATLLALREVMTMNADSIFFHRDNDEKYFDSNKKRKRERNGNSTIPGDARRQRQYQKEEETFRSQNVATGVVLNALNRLQPDVCQDIFNEFMRAANLYDTAGDEFTSCLERADGRCMVVLPNGAALGREENVAWRVSYNRTRDCHPLIKGKRRREVFSRLHHRRAIISDGNRLGRQKGHHRNLIVSKKKGYGVEDDSVPSSDAFNVPQYRTEVPSANACAVYIVERLPFAQMRAREMKRNNIRRIEEERSLFRHHQKKILLSRSKRRLVAKQRQLEAAAATAPSLALAATDAVVAEYNNNQHYQQQERQNKGSGIAIAPDCHDGLLNEGAGFFPPTVTLSQQEQHQEGKGGEAAAPLQRNESTLSDFSV